MTSPPGASPPPVPAPSPADRLRVAWADRARTDYRFVSPWLNVLLIVVTCGIYGLYLFYQLVRRSRDHNRRRLELLDAATTFAWDESYRRGLTDELRPGFERIAGQLQVLRAMTTEFRDPAIWLVLALIANGIAQIVAFILLDQDLVEHERAEHAVEVELAAIFERLGQPLAPTASQQPKGRNGYVGRVVATVATCGIYTLWWWVDQQRDGDAHYAANWPWEDALAQAVGNLQSAG